MGDRPRAGVDHVLVPAVDLAEAARRFAGEHGLHALDGGRHPGVGTANMIIPLGRTYIELIAVVDETEAARFPRSRRIGEAAREGRPFATWAARTDDLDGLRSALVARGWDLPPISAGARVRPDGVRLEWRTQELSRDLGPSVLPFLIQWNVPPGAHPAEQHVAHPSRAGDVISLTFTAPDPGTARARLRDLVGETVALEVQPGPRQELVAVDLDSPGGGIRIA